jgi:putative hydrolase of the HAD superfamily
MNDKPDIKVVLFDFGGVLAEEGFKAGLTAIAEKNGLNPKEMISTAFKTIYEIGFVTGKVREDAFWSALRQETGISQTDGELTQEILSRFTLRPWMLQVVNDLKKRGIIVGILSDQSHWLDELNKRHGFFRLFHQVFNSFHLGLTKKDTAIFDHVLQRINVMPKNVLFIDDHLAHIERAQSKGIYAIFYTDKEKFCMDLKKFFPDNQY